jgi:golgi phosphoprotein 3
MLTAAEELFLLAHDNQSGNFTEIPGVVLDRALAGAVLMELSILDRIDTDLEKLVVIDRTPTGERLLDYALEQIAAESAVHSPSTWLDILQKHGQELQDMAIESLIQRGILREEKGTILWVFETRRYPLIDGREQMEVKRRIANLLLSDEIPEPRDIIIISLAEVCGVLQRVFSHEELERAGDRIQQIVRLDLIGHAMRESITELQNAILTMAAYHTH